MRPLSRHPWRQRVSSALFAASLERIMEFSQLLSLVLHVDKSLDTMLLAYGSWVYAVLFAIVFAETGLVVFPFLPAIRSCSLVAHSVPMVRCMPEFSSCC